MSDEELIKLRAATDDAIGIVETSEPRVSSAVNWADLHCLQAAWVRTDTGEHYAEVTIEEAAPEAYEFQAAIAAELAKAGWPDVRVVTEW
jgi:hypothetical protein